MFKDLKYILTVLFLWVLTAYSQYGFQKVYDHHEIDTLSILSDIYVLNDSIYFSGGGRTGNSYGLRFAKVDEITGELESLMRYDIEDHAQRAFYSNVDTDTNFRGNLVNLYRSFDLDFTRNGYRLVEYNLTGSIIFDSLYDIWETDSTLLFDQTYLIHELNDSSYIQLISYVDQKENGSTLDTRGVLIRKSNYLGDEIWSKKIFNSAFNYALQLGGNHIEKRPSGGFNLHYREVRVGSENLGTFWAKQHFAELDDTGNIITDKVFQDGVYCYTFSEAFFDGDTIYLQYYDSKLYNEGENNAHYKAKPVLAKIGPDMEIIWKNELQNFWGNSPSLSGSMKRIRKVNDTSFVGARNHNNRISGSPTELPLISTKKVRLYNFTDEGEYNWIRDYYYYPIDSIRDPYYEINDIEIMPDGGFVLGGESRNVDSLNQGKPGQFAYLLRTNCLGFLSPPEAQLSYESDQGEVLFVNNSMNAGSYTYYFGNGDSLNTREDVDSVLYTYQNEGEYEVTLIAHGCNGAADTVKLQVAIELEEETYGNIGGNYFTLYPNPVQQGNLITIETGNVENAEIQFYDSQGRLVKTVPLPSAKSIYFIEHTFAAGNYAVQLTHKNEVLQRRKMIVQ